MLARGIRNRLVNKSRSVHQLMLNRDGFTFLWTQHFLLRVPNINLVDVAPYAVGFFGLALWQKVS